VKKTKRKRKVTKPKMKQGFDTKRLFQLAPGDYYPTRDQTIE
jgi:hypothetical protein